MIERAVGRDLPGTRLPWRAAAARTIATGSIAALLLLAGCGIVSIGVTNSPDWCPNPNSRAACP